MCLNLIIWKSNVNRTCSYFVAVMTNGAPLLGLRLPRGSKCGVLWDIFLHHHLAFLNGGGSPQFDGYHIRPGQGQYLLTRLTHVFWTTNGISLLASSTTTWNRNAR